MAKTGAPASGRRLSVTEVLDLRFVPDEGLALDEPLPTEWIDLQLAAVGRGATAIHAIKEAPGSVKLEIDPLAPVATRPPIRIHGSIGAAIETTCVRCLEPIRQDLVAKVDLTLFAATAQPDRPGRGPAPPPEDEGLLKGELDHGAYEKNEIDLPSLVREALLLAIAMNPACEDESTCTARTSAMLEAANRPASAVESDRWAPLRRLAEAVQAKDGNEPDGEN